MATSAFLSRSACSAFSQLESTRPVLFAWMSITVSRLASCGSGKTMHGTSVHFSKPLFS